MENMISFLVRVIFYLVLLLTWHNVSAGSPLLPVDRENLKEYLTRTNVYTTWQLWPGTDFFYKGRHPHGALLTTYVNDIALAALRAGEDEFSAGSIIVKENYLELEP